MSEKLDREYIGRQAEEIKALKEKNEALLLTAEIFKTESEIKDIMKEENKSLKKILKEIKEVEHTSFLPDGDSINVSTGRWLERLIQTFEALKEKETK